MIKDYISNQELKKLLIDKIHSTEDSALLEEAIRLLDIEINDSEIYILSESELDAISEARQQIKNGECLTNEEAYQLINKWLKK